MRETFLPISGRGGSEDGKGVAELPEVGRDFRLEHQVDRNALVDLHAFHFPFQLATGFLRQNAGYREVEIGFPADATFRVRTERDKFHSQRLREVR